MLAERDKVNYFCFKREPFEILVLPFNEIAEIIWEWIIFPIATFHMKNGEEYKVIIFNKVRFNKYYQEYSST